MSTAPDIPDDPWIFLNRSCPMTCDVIGDSAQFELGTATGTVNLVADEDGLAKLVTVATAALTGMRAVPEGAEVEFVVTDPDLVPADQPAHTNSPPTNGRGRTSTAQVCASRRRR